MDELLLVPEHARDAHSIVWALTLVDMPSSGKLFRNLAQVSSLARYGIGATQPLGHRHCFLQFGHCAVVLGLSRPFNPRLATLTPACLLPLSYTRSA